MKRAAAFGAITLASIALLTSSVGAGTTAPVPQRGEAPAADLQQQLADRFAPIMMLKEQSAECDTEGEQFLPSVVDIVLDNPEVALRQVGGGDPVVMRGPGASDLVGLGQGFFLDFPGSSLEPECIYERDFRKYSGDRPATIYAHVVQQPDRPDLVFVQYWFYWYYNDWNNKHESDWEGITLKFEASSVEEALASEPVAVGYAQHVGGERAGWDDTKLERDGDHPVVYSAAGSHASYYSEALYLGRAPSQGFGCDNTSGPSLRVEPEVVVLPDSVNDPNDPFAWLAYNGRWGERQKGSFNAPDGPAAKARWSEPSPWFDELRDSSVVIPTGDSQGASVVSLFCNAVERGSRMLVTFTVSPARLLTMFVIVGLIAMFLIRRTEWNAVDPNPIRRRRKAGQIVRAATGSYRREPLVYLLFGLVYVPAAMATGLLTKVVSLIPFVDALTSLAGSTSGTRLFLSLLVGSIANTAAFVVVNSLVADYRRHEARGLEAATASARRVWGRRGDIAGVFVRSFGIVLALLLTVVGTPWAIRQLVRYQFISQVVMIEDVSGGEALRRSSQLVRRRWFHTAIFVAGVNGLVAVVALAVGIVLLVAGSGLPLWMFSALATLAYVVMVPLAAISMTSLYGDAAVQGDEDNADQRDEDAADLVPAV